jgi:hypothetical protein
VTEYAILSYTRNSGFWLDNWRSACPERLFSMPKSRYFMKAEVVIQTKLSDEASARVFKTAMAVVGHYHITIHIIFDIALCIIRGASSSSIIRDDFDIIYGLHATLYEVLLTLYAVLETFNNIRGA